MQVSLHFTHDRRRAADVARILSAAGHRVVDGPADVIVTDDSRLVEKVRRTDTTTPILVVAPDEDVLSRIAALRAGADDAIGTPFHPSQVVARVDALGRRGALTPKRHEVLEADDCEIDLDALTATRDEYAVPLTPREAALLRFLHANADRPVSRAELLRVVWNQSGDVDTRSVDMTVARLRKKIERDPSEPCIVVSVQRVGYRWVTQSTQ